MLKKYFGTDGIRGEVGIYPITPDFAMHLGYALGSVLCENFANPTVLIGKDTRISGYLFESSLEAGLSYSGVDIFMAGPLPTPAVAFLTKNLQLSSGIVISASHNHYKDNGIKIFSAGGTKLDDTLELKIENQLNMPMKIGSRLGKVTRIDSCRDQYSEFCKKTFLDGFTLNGLVIVLDCANGATYQIAPKIFEDLGAKVIKIGCEPNGININDQCGATNLNSLIEAVKLNHADFGVAFDGDGDRVMFVDSEGLVYNGDKLVYIIMKLYISLNKQIDGIVGTIMTNFAMEQKLQQLGIKFIRTQVGDRYILEELKKRNWILGAESSGHILCLDKHTTGDGIVSALQVISSILLHKQSLSELIDWQEYPQVIINVQLNNDTQNWQNKIKSVVNDAKHSLHETGRVVVRASGTEPVLRIMVEAVSHDDAIFWANKIAQNMN